ncbi:MAG TPA: hypothetical protein VL051_10390 [Burkholderiaceae bacterium]|nr:hypothetical protein [Burkholderiaceae bacterium]
MNSEPIDPMFPEMDEECTQHPELMVSAVLHLMSHYTISSRESCVCARLAAIIERHLKTLAALPELAPVLRATCQQLSWQWEIIAERMLPAAKQSGQSSH